MPNFAEKVEVAVDALTSNPQKDVDENEFIDASRLVYDGVRDIRRAVLLNRVRYVQVSLCVLIIVFLSARSVVTCMIAIFLLEWTCYNFRVLMT